MLNEGELSIDDPFRGVRYEIERGFSVIFLVFWLAAAAVEIPSSLSCVKLPGALMKHPINQFKVDPCAISGFRAPHS